MPEHPVAKTYLLWLTRFAAALLLVLWGAFFWRTSKSGSSTARRHRLGSGGPRRVTC